MYIFPGIGLGSILSRTRHVSDAMVEQAAIALASSLTEEEKAAELVYPRLARIRDISAQVAFAVIRQAQKEVRREQGSCLCRNSMLIFVLLQKLDDNAYLRTLPDADLLGLIHDKMWQPPALQLRSFTRL
jgi:malate dehydrogenase (oxaloacetate-decarboxylating)(NADP+)